MTTRIGTMKKRFQSTAPVWGPTRIFEEGNAVHEFQSTAPVWGPTVGGDYKLGLIEFQSTAPVWGPTRHPTEDDWNRCISIHGPRVGADHPADC